MVLLKPFHTHRCHFSYSVFNQVIFLLEIFSSSGHIYVCTSCSLCLYWCLTYELNILMFSATWGHISCVAVAPALRFPRFLFVNRSWQFSQTTKLPVPVLCRKHPLVSRAGNPVVRLSYPQLFSLHIITVLQPLLLQGRTNTIDFTPQTQLTFLTENWATGNFLHDQFSSPTTYDQPFSQTPINAFFLWLVSTYLCGQIPRLFLLLF